MKKSKSVARYKIKPQSEADELLAIVERLKICVTPSIGGGWSAWYETEGRENQTIIIRRHAPTLREVIRQMEQ